MSDVKITCQPNGSVIVDGAVEIFDKFGRPLHKKGKGSRHVFCGCGQSNERPFCDGSHNRGGSDDDDE